MQFFPLQTVGCTSLGMHALAPQWAYHIQLQSQLCIHPHVLIIPLPFVTETRPLTFTSNYVESNVPVIWMYVHFNLNGVCTHDS